MFAVTGADYSSGFTFYDVFGLEGELENENAVVDYREVDLEDGIDETYLTIGTNDTTGFTVAIGSATQLSTGLQGSSLINYEISVGTATWDTLSPPSQAADKDIITVQPTAGGGAKVVSTPITVELDWESYYNADASNNYTAQVVFVISST